MIPHRKKVHFRHTYGDLCAEVLLGSPWCFWVFSSHAAVMGRGSCIVYRVRKVDYIKSSGKRSLEISIVWEAKWCFSQNTRLSCELEGTNLWNNALGRRSPCDSLGYISNTWAWVFCPKIQSCSEGLLVGLAAGQNLLVCGHMLKWMLWSVLLTDPSKPTTGRLWVALNPNCGWRHRYFLSG